MSQDARMKRNLYNDVTPRGLPCAHYGFNVTFDIDDDNKNTKEAIEYFDYMVKDAMKLFKKHCRDKKIRLSNMELE